MNRRFGLAPLIGLALASTLVLSGCEGIHNPFSSAGPGGGVTLTDAGKKTLTVSPSDLLEKANESAICKSNVFLDHALRPVEKGNAEARDNTHAPSIPMKADNEKAALTEVMAEHCGNPTELYMTLKALSTWKFDGWKLVENNKWISDFLSAAESKGLRTTTLSYKTKDSKDIIVTVDYQKTAAMTNTLLLRAQNAGFVTAPSVTNWIVKGDDTVGELPLSVPNSEQEGLAALRFEFTEKGTGCFAAFGYNKLDKRFETFKCRKEVAPAPVGTTAPTVDKKSAGTTGSTSKHCPATYPNCLEPKDPAKDPQRKGSVPPQVQGKNPPLPAQAEAPAVLEPVAPYVPPAPPAPVAPPTTSRAAEPSAPVAGANTPTPGASTCAPPPGKTSC